MAMFWKAAAIVLLSVIFGSVLSKTDRDISSVLMVFACCVVLMAALDSLAEVVSFMMALSKKTENQMPFLPIILRISGVAIVAELIDKISSDAGYASLGKVIALFANIVILSLSLPLYETFIAVIQEILGMV